MFWVSAAGKRGRGRQRRREADAAQPAIDQHLPRAVHRRHAAPDVTQGGDAARQLLRQPHIVLVGEGGEVGGRQLRRRPAQQRHETAQHAQPSRRVNDLLAAAAVGERLHGRDGRVARPVVAPQQPPVGIGLGAQARQQVGEVAAAVVGGEQDADPGRVHDHCTMAATVRATLSSQGGKAHAERRLQPAAVEPRIGRPPRRCRPVGGRDRRDLRPGTAMARRRVEHRAGEPVPRRLAAAGGVVDAGGGRGRLEIGDREDRRREVGRRGRAAALVGHHPQMRRALRRVQHGEHEILPRRRIDPGRAQDHRARARGQHRLFARQLARAVDAGRAGRVLLDIGCALEPVEYVIGRNVDKRHAGPRAPLRRAAAGPSRLARIAASGSPLGLIDPGIGGGVDDQRGCRGVEQRRQRLRAVEVEVRPTDAAHRPLPGALDECPGKLPAAAGHQDHTRNQIVARRLSGGRRASLSESTGGPTRTGPGQRQIGVVPDHAALGRRVVAGGDLVEHVGRPARACRTRAGTRRGSRAGCPFSALSSAATWRP